MQIELSRTLAVLFLRGLVVGLLVVGLLVVDLLVVELRLHVPWNVRSGAEARMVHGGRRARRAHVVLGAELIVL